VHLLVNVKLDFKWLSTRHNKNMVEIFDVGCLILHGVRVKLLNYTPGGSRDNHSSVTSLSN